MLTPARFPFYITYITYIQDSHFTLHTLHYMHILHFTEKNALIATFLGKKLDWRLFHSNILNKLSVFVQLSTTLIHRKSHLFALIFEKFTRKYFTLALLVVSVTNSTCALSFLRVQKLINSVDSTQIKT